MKTVRKQIGSRIDTVRRNYIAYRILRQTEKLGIEVSQAGIDNRFSVLFLSLREAGVRDFLGVDITAEPEGRACFQFRPTTSKNLSDFAKWLFGTDDTTPLFTDSRYVGKLCQDLGQR